MFDIIINNIFFFEEKLEICNFADDKTIYSCREDLLKITENLICTMKNILKWFRLNCFKADPGEFQFKILGDKTCYEHMLKINLTCVQSSDDVTLLGIITDKSLTFKKYIDNFVRKAQYQLHALWCIRRFHFIVETRILDIAFIVSQFNYAPVLWMI